jgi:hypothetical protein
MGMISKAPKWQKRTLYWWGKCSKMRLSAVEITLYVKNAQKMAHLRFYFIFMLLKMLITGHMTHHFEALNQLVSLKTTLFF